MASSTLGFTLIHSLPSRTLWVTSGFLNHPFLKSHVSTVSSSSSNHINQLKLKQFPLPRASSSEEASSELIEDSKFVPLNADDPIYGPPALLLLGFEVEETVKMQQLLKELDGEFLQVAKSLPRICFLSGLSGEEMMMFIDAFPETGLESAVFAALVPNSADKPLQELIEEIMGDHEMMTANQSSST
ncbi:uncharacterized protein LOC121245952 isoform X2 [Juglans microcarpa x Juglans regia]|uniref:uncharacterized protein LOC121245952 isoform X2 n=1 Tax=Juglans microcarpa x Juglans regia TaxID=2249226 RepID=UPI001B7DC666|nr:uncharacterized protein LOC121245952 isoform X2 [Juglans microcarpa x Juglans regia]